MFGEEYQFEEGCYKTPERIRRQIAQRELRDLCIQPCWRSKGGQASLHYDNSSSSRCSIFSKAESASDIVNCNNRLRNEKVVVEYVRIWEVGKQLGMECCSCRLTRMCFVRSCDSRIKDTFVLVPDLHPTPP